MNNNDDEDEDEYKYDNNDNDNDNPYDIEKQMFFLQKIEENDDNDNNNDHNDPPNTQNNNYYYHTYDNNGSDSPVSMSRCSSMECFDYYQENELFLDEEKTATPIPKKSLSRSQSQSTNKITKTPPYTPPTQYKTLSSSSRHPSQSSLYQPHQQQPQSSSSQFPISAVVPPIIKCVSYPKSLNTLSMLKINDNYNINSLDKSNHNFPIHPPIIITSNHNTPTNRTNNNNNNHSTPKQQLTPRNIGNSNSIYTLSKSKDELLAKTKPRTPPPPQTPHMALVCSGQSLNTDPTGGVGMFGGLAIRSSTSIAPIPPPHMASVCSGQSLIAPPQQQQQKIKKFREFTYEEIEQSINSYYNNETKYGSEFDLIITFIKGQKNMYLLSKNITQQKYNLLFIPSILLIASMTVFVPFIQKISWSEYLISSLNALIVFMLGIISFFKLETKVCTFENLTIQYEKLESSLDLTSGKLLFIENKTEKMNVIITQIKEIERKINDIKDTYSIFVPNEIKRILPNICNINIFSLIKKNEISKKGLISSFKNIKNEMRYILYKWEVEDYKRKISNDRDNINNRNNESIINLNNESLLSILNDYPDRDSPPLFIAGSTTITASTPTPTQPTPPTTTRTNSILNHTNSIHNQHQHPAQLQHNQSHHNQLQQQQHNQSLHNMNMNMSSDDNDDDNDDITIYTDLKNKRKREKHRYNKLLNVKNTLRNKITNLNNSYFTIEEFFNEEIRQAENKIHFWLFYHFFGFLMKKPDITRTLFDIDRCCDDK